MNKYLLSLLCIIVTTIVSAQIPEWYQAEMERMIGTWVANNNEYMSEEETDNAYALRWDWGAGKKSIIGRLYGMKDGVQTKDYWQFVQFWDSEAQKGRVIQISANGVVGEGYLEPVSEGKTKLEQTFTPSDGAIYSEGHRTKIFPDHEVLTTYKIIQDRWVEDRSYTWYKE